MGNSSNTSLSASGPCNGLTWLEMNITYPAGVCMSAVENGFESSWMVSCTGDDDGLVSSWTGLDCQGNTTMDFSVPVEYLFSADEASMTCGAMDCPYAMVAGWTVSNMTSNITTSTPSNITTAEPTDCDSGNLTSWEDVAVSLSVDCEEWGDINGTTYYVDWLCEDGDFVMAFYPNSSCTGSPVGAESHAVMEQFVCPRVNCSAAVSLYPSTAAPSVEPTVEPTVSTSAEPSLEPTVVPSRGPSSAPTTMSTSSTADATYPLVTDVDDSYEPTDITESGAAPMGHLIAVVLAVITLMVAGN